MYGTVNTSTPESTSERIRRLLADAKIEIQRVLSGSSALLGQLTLLEQYINDGRELTDVMVLSAMAEFPPIVRAGRAGRPAYDALKSTRELWEELNHIVTSKAEKRD
jgi:hypothetical protein